MFTFSTLLHIHIMFSLHVYDLAFILGGAGDAAGVKQEGCQASDHSSILCFNICMPETKPKSVFFVP